MTTETFPCHLYEVVKEQKSKIDPSYTQRVTVGIRCPRCRHVNPTIEHGETRICSKCRLRMTLHGNNLQCTVLD